MDNPYRSGAYAPVTKEISCENLAVRGQIPTHLSGSYVRNGPNPRFDAPGRYHWFDGDGMLHAVRFEGGKASYKNRYVRTEGFVAEEKAKKALWSGLLEPVGENPKGKPYKDTGNTDVVPFRGDLLASWYISGAVSQVDAQDLSTKGTTTFGLDDKLRMSAHCKVDERAGELLFFDYGPKAPFLRFGKVNSDGRLKHLTSVDLPGPRLPHDMAVTENHAILMDLPLFYADDALAKGKWRIGFHRELPARFGVIPREGGAPRWFEAEPCYIYHTVNAWEEGNKVVLLACRVEDPTPVPKQEDGALKAMMANLRIRARLHRYEFDLSTGETKEVVVDDLNTEFPAINNQFLGLKNRYSYHARLDVEHTIRFDGIVKYDLTNGGSQVIEMANGQFASEAVFAPRPGSTEEDDGHVIAFVHDQNTDTSETWVIDARSFDDGPVAKITMPQRVPLGFHACWASS